MRKIWGEQGQGRNSKPDEEGRDKNYRRFMIDLTEGRFNASRIHSC